MPGKNGYEVASYIKHSPRLAHIPVLLLTGAFEPIDQRRAADAGCDGVLAKPFEPQFVIGRVRELLGMSAGRADAEEARGPVMREIATPPPVHSAETSETAASSFEHSDNAIVNSTGPQGGGEQTIELDGDVSVATEDPSTDGHPPARSLQVVSEASGSATHPDPAHEAEPPPEADIFGIRSQKPALPALAEAFAALLAAEQSPSTPATEAAWPPPAPYAVSDEVVDRVVERVLERLSDRILRDAVADIVSRVAERMVRDEIDRIKASVK
jgi:CheY-like chemotaxis protein